MLCFLGLSVYAQEAPPPEPGQHSLVGALNLTQVQLEDWAQGGENSLSWALNLDGKSENDLPKTNWATTYKFAFAQTKLGDLGVRKTDDKIDLETLFTYKVGVYVNPYVAATAKTQFAKGFDYPEDGGKVERSKFFDPGYLTQSAGLGYEPTPQVKTRIGVALREIVASEFAASFTDDSETVDELEKTQVDGGLESVTDVAWNLKENILVTSKLEIFSAFSNFTDAVVRNDTNIAVKVSKYITVNFNTQIVSDTTASPHVQIKETLSLGLNYTLF